MTAVGLGQRGSQAVGSGLESLPAKSFYDLSLLFWILEISETLKDSPLWKVSALRHKILDGNF